MVNNGGGTVSHTERISGVNPNRFLIAAFASMLLLSAPQRSSAMPGDADTTAPAWCNPRLAGAISVFLPGAGQMYAGETVKGAILSSAFVGGVVGVATANIGRTHDSIRPGGWAAVIVVASSYLYALVDAPFAAARWNDAHHIEQPRMSALPARPSIVSISISL
jgi:hypothetical protein